MTQQTIMSFAVEKIALQTGGLLTIVYVCTQQSLLCIICQRERMSDTAVWGSGCDN